MKIKNTVKWYIIDAENEILGRLSSKISILLQGKNKIEYLPYINISDYIIIINSKKIKITGKKYFDKTYFKYTGYIGNLKSIKFKDLLNKNSNFIIRESIRRMLPKNNISKIILRKLKIYEDSNYKNISQNPIKLKI
ncbi:50S ribosomal protein L13 [endosymbiont of Sipalinus gigas]|uniref:50S ribosomal protein L13 n=1 Tax=endosymbiont of Sipalinus gigas TaxID=1972134 RepID=UPI000DC6EA1B|nr:50S ribosomal protein L13 [endosymbiont of Sipalinus gigas]BBA85307.1 50S ribosomal protein L13 [endosymbiont of Sipalinus gigas]